MAAAAVGGACAAAYASGGAATATHRPNLPKVHIRPDHRGFVARGGRPFTPCGCAYFRPNTGWAPQIWKKFDVAATRRDLLLLKAHHFNVVRLFLASNAFYPKPGALNGASVDKLDQFLDSAAAAGIYVQICGLDRWEGTPKWQLADAFTQEDALAARTEFWAALAARYRGNNAIFAYELGNEPAVAWNTPGMRTAWNQWRHAPTPIPAAADKPGDPTLLAFQNFRERLAERWTRQPVATIKKADPAALVTVGLIQWSVPAVANPVNLYSGFRPAKIAKYLDFMEIHFYPLADGIYTYQSDAVRIANLAYLESVMREMDSTGRAVVLAEFGWYGGGALPNAGNRPPATQQQQATFCSQEVNITEPLACGWLNWAMYDTPAAQDVTRFSGLFQSDGKIKTWGRQFAALVADFHKNPPAPHKVGPRPALPWDACLTSSKAAAKFQKEYLHAFRREMQRT